MTRRIVAGLAASLAVLVVYVDARRVPVEARCARSLNVEWSRAEGATERLAAFAQCVGAGR